MPEYMLPEEEFDVLGQGTTLAKEPDLGPSGPVELSFPVPEPAPKPPELTPQQKQKQKQDAILAKTGLRSLKGIDFVPGDAAVFGAEPEEPEVPGMQPTQPGMQPTQLGALPDAGLYGQLGRTMKSDQELIGELKRSQERALIAQRYRDQVVSQGNAALAGKYDQMAKKEQTAADNIKRLRSAVQRGMKDRFNAYVDASERVENFEFDPKGWWNKLSTTDKAITGIGAAMTAIAEGLRYRRTGEPPAGLASKQLNERIDRDLAMQKQHYSLLQQKAANKFNLYANYRELGMSDVEAETLSRDNMLRVSQKELEAMQYRYKDKATQAAIKVNTEALKDEQIKNLAKLKNIAWEKEFKNRTALADIQGRQNSLTIKAQAAASKPPFELTKNKAVEMLSAAEGVIDNVKTLKAIRAQHKKAREGFSGYASGPITAMAKKIGVETEGTKLEQKKLPFITEYLKAISGVAVSAQEYDRIYKLLPLPSEAVASGNNKIKEMANHMISKLRQQSTMLEMAGYDVSKYKIAVEKLKKEVQSIENSYSEEPVRPAR